jgi:hypothetical protein
MSESFEPDDTNFYSPDPVTMQMYAALLRAQKRIKRLEEAGDAMADLLEGKAVTWNKAKENKP